MKRIVMLFVLVAGGIFAAYQVDWRPFVYSASFTVVDAETKNLSTRARATTYTCGRAKLFSFLPGPLHIDLREVRVVTTRSFGGTPKTSTPPPSSRPVSSQDVMIDGIYICSRYEPPWLTGADLTSLLAELDER